MALPLKVSVPSKAQQHVWRNKGDPMPGGRERGVPVGEFKGWQ